MDLESAIYNAIVSVVQEQLEPIANRLNSAEKNIADHEKAIGNNDGRADLSGRLDVQAATINDVLSRVMEIAKHQDAHIDVANQLNRRIATLERVRMPITEVEPQDLDEAIRERVQPLRDDLDDLESKVKQYTHDTDDRLEMLEGGLIEVNKDLNRVIEIATKDLHARLKALEGRHAPETPANDSQTIENICAALEAHYVDHARFLFKSGVPQTQLQLELSDYHHATAYEAYQRARTRVWKGFEEKAPEAA